MSQSFSAFAGCGCSHSFLFNRLVEWKRCVDHYKPEEDDSQILIAAKNKREIDAELKAEQKAA